MRQQYPQIKSIALIVGVVLTGLGTSVLADDWPQWRGLDRLGVWQETGIVEKLPDELRVSWRTSIRSGYSGPAVAQQIMLNKLFGLEGCSKSLHDPSVQNVGNV